MPPGDDGQPITQPQNGSAAAVATDWRTHLTPELQADPVVKGWSEKASEKDIASLIKTAAHGQHRLGSAITLPGKDAKPEDVAALRTKLYEAGVFNAPPPDATGYGLKKIDGLPEGLQWSQDLADKFGGVLLKHGVPKGALDELMPLYLEALTGSVKTLQVDREKSIAALKEEHGDQYEIRKEAVGRIINGIFKTKEEMDFAESMQLADHPGFLSVLLRLAPLAMQDSSFMESLPHAGGELSSDAAKAELAKIISDPTHKHHLGFKKIPMDPEADRYVQDLYKRAYGNMQRQPESVGAG